MKIIFLLVSYMLRASNADENDENFNIANKFIFNNGKNCQINQYFDIDLFKCRLCDPNFNLVNSQRGMFTDVYFKNIL